MAKKYFAPVSASPLWIATVLVAVGLVLLVFTAQHQTQKLHPATNQSPTIQVTDAGGKLNQDQTGDSANNLQKAARVKDIAPGKNGSDVQPGGNVDDLSKDKKIQ